MIRRTLLLVPVVLVALLATAAPGQADRTAELGFEDPAVAPGPALDADTVIANWAGMGVRWVRVQAFWDALSPNPRSRTRPPGFDVSNPNDRRYNWASRGMRVIMTVHQFNPVWASSEPRRGRMGWKPDPRLYGQWATALARRYGGQVDRWLLGNEPNQRIFMQPQTECGRVGRRTLCERTAANIYRELVRAAYPAIKRSDRSGGNQVLLGELAPIGAAGPRAGNLAPLPFIRAIGCLDDSYRRIVEGACRRFRPARADGFGYHPYQVRERPTQPQRNPNLAKLGDLPRLFGVLDATTRSGRIGAPGRRFNLYITEYGYETNPPDRAHGVSLQTQSKYLQESAYIVWKTPRVKLITQYLWRDDAFSFAGHAQGFQTGLRFANNVAKPSLFTFPHPIFVDQASRTLWGQVRAGGAHRVQVFRQVGRGAFVPWRSVQTDGLGYFRIRGGLVRNSNYFFRYIHNGLMSQSDYAHAR
jgi:hypothetical protein